jgi:uncharacterized membrane protein
VIAFAEEHPAADAMATLQRLEQQGALDLEDAVVVTKNSEGHLTFHQSVSLTDIGATNGAIRGALTGAVSRVLVDALGLMSGFGTALGASVGAILRNFTDHGIKDSFVRDLGVQLEPASSALVVLVRSIQPIVCCPKGESHGIAHTTNVYISGLQAQHYIVVDDNIHLLSQILTTQS